MITNPPATRNQFNTTTGNILVAAPQLELGSSPKSYIPRGAEAITRAANVIGDDMNLSVFRLYGSRDFAGRRGESIVGPPGESIVGPQGPPGSNLNLPPWVSSDQASISLSNFNGSLSYSRLTEIPAQITLPSWILPSQANVSLLNFSGTLSSVRIEDFPQWLNNTQENIQLANFGGSLEYYKLTNVPLPASLPTWSSTILQSSVSLSDFGGQVNWNNQVSKHPTFNRSTLTGKSS
jgi:hypothetical protein